MSLKWNLEANPNVFIDDFKHNYLIHLYSAFIKEFEYNIVGRVISVDLSIQQFDRLEADGKGCLF